MDRKSENKIKEKQGKWSKSFFDMTNIFTWEYIWRRKHEEVRGYTFYFGRHRLLSRIDLILTNKVLLNSIWEVKILAKTCADHNPIRMVMKKRNEEYSWRLNENLLKEGNFLNG